MLRVWVLTVFTLAGLVAPAAAQTLEQAIAHRLQKAPHKNYLSFSFENDSIGGGSDRFYTSGARLTWYNANADVPDLIDEFANSLPTFEINSTTSTYFTLGQNMYTPEDITIRTPQDRDRPWAGFLYGSVGLTSITNNHLDDVELTLGVVGPEAMAEQTQKFIHRHVTGSSIPKGWNNQLDFEPGLILSWQRRWPNYWIKTFGDFRLAAEPNVNVSLGNIYTYAGSGLSFTFGPYQNALQDTPPRVRPSLPGSGAFITPDQDWSWYLFAGIDGRAMARNIFLDGNSFDDDPSVSKKPLVGDATAGLALTLKNYRLSYAINMRSKEFDGQDSESVYGSMTLTSRF